MLSILGVGCAHPATVIDNSFLVTLGLDVCAESIRERTGIEDRRTCLPLEYIKATKNLERAKVPGVILETPTDLALRACREAVDRAGIMPERIGLILAECTYPLQSVPCEAQRVAGLLELRIPAYDLNSGGVGLPFFLDRLAKWRPDALPEYVLCLSVSTPTHAVDYSRGVEGLVFGDGAGAAVVSLVQEGPWQVMGAFWETRCLDEIPSYPLTGHISLNPGSMGLARRQRVERLDGVLNAMRCCVDSSQSATLILSSSFMFAGIDGIGNGKTYSLWGGNRKYGELMGVGAFCALAEAWDAFEPEWEWCLIEPGFGLGYGGVVLRSHVGKVGLQEGCERE